MILKCDKLIKLLAKFCILIHNNLNITIGSIPCTHISIQSIGDSTYDGWYEQHVFGTYSFLLIDERGNNIYHAKMEAFDFFITKVMENEWIVSVTILPRSKRINNNLRMLVNNYQGNYYVYIYIDIATFRLVLKCMVEPLYFTIRIAKTLHPQKCVQIPGGTSMKFPNGRLIMN